MKRNLMKDVKIGEAVYVSGCFIVDPNTRACTSELRVFRIASDGKLVPSRLCDGETARLLTA